MKPRKNAEMSEATRGLLLSKARAAFGEHGYAGAPIEEVVRAAGLTRGALYHHFGSKQGLFEAVVRDLDQEIMQRVLAATSPGTDLWDGLRSACRVYLEATLDPTVRRVLLLDCPAVLGIRGASILDDELSIRPLVAALKELRAAGVLRAVDLEATAHLLSGALYDAALWIGDHPDPRGALTRALEALGLLLGGLASPRRRTR